MSAEHVISLPPLVHTFKVKFLQFSLLTFKICISFLLTFLCEAVPQFGTSWAEKGRGTSRGHHHSVMLPLSDLKDCLGFPFCFVPNQVHICKAFILPFSITFVLFPFVLLESSLFHNLIFHPGLVLLVASIATVPLLCTCLCTMHVAPCACLSAYCLTLSQTFPCPCPQSCATLSPACSAALLLNRPGPLLMLTCLLEQGSWEDEVEEKRCAHKAFLSSDSAITQPAFSRISPEL